jgi:hypothetical protein
MNWARPTGYSRGRPRKGEIRPGTGGGAKQTKYRAAHKDDPEWKHIRAMYQQFWYYANRDRAQEIARNCYYRKKSWEEAQGNIKVTPL